MKVSLEQLQTKTVCSNQNQSPEHFELTFNRTVYKLNFTRILETGFHQNGIKTDFYQNI
jgi:hypothetical protein